jgi:hypothetical protein
MAHDPERQAAAFLAGELDPRSRHRFSEHLLDCDACWQEVRDAQRGRALAESARVVSPTGLRERVRALVLAEEHAEASPPISVRPSRRTRTLVALLLAGTTAVAAAVLSARPSDSPAQDPPALTAAVSDFRARELPGRRLPAGGAPDLSRIRMVPVGAGGGRYGELVMDGYAYRDGAGRRLVVYLSQQPFPTAPGATRLEGADGPWTAHRGDVVILCARAPHALLVVGQDAALVRDAAEELGVL